MNSRIRSWIRQRLAFPSTFFVETWTKLLRMSSDKYLFATFSWVIPFSSFTNPSAIRWRIWWLSIRNRILCSKADRDSWRTKFFSYLLELSWQEWSCQGQPCLWLQLSWVEVHHFISGIFNTHNFSFPNEMGHQPRVMPCKIFCPTFLLHPPKSI